jgi:peptidoglycan/LPS O-acetylase OafA/YrhL
VGHRSRSWSAAAINIEAVSSLLRRGAALAVSMILICAPPNPATDLISSLGIAGVIGWIYLNQSNAFVRKMDSGIVGYLGMISYGLYIRGFLAGNGSYRDARWPPNIWIGAALTFPVAALSFKYFERPLKRHGVLAPKSVRLDAKLPT